MDKKKRQATARLRAINHHLFVMQGKIPEPKLAELMAEIEKLNKALKCQK